MNLQIQKAIAKLVTLSETGEKAANVAGSKTLNIRSASLVQSYVVKKISKFPVGESFQVPAVE